MLSKRYSIGLVVLLAAAFGLSTVAFAGDEAPAAAPAKPAAEKAAEPTKTATKEEAATKTPSPMHTMMVWVVSEVMDEPACPSTEKGAKQMRAWFAGGKDVKHAGLRDMLVQHGWNADRTMTFFAKMTKSGSCGDCNGEKSCGGCPSKGASDATGASSDAAGADSKGDCGGCPSKGASDAAGADSKGDCDGCTGCKGNCDGCPSSCPGKKSAAPKKDAKP